MLDEKVGYIQLFDFAGDCFDRFQEQLNTLIKQGAQALIIDLRDNPGGWVDDAIHLADLFMPKETITYLQYRDGEREYYTATDGALSLPMLRSVWLPCWRNWIFPPWCMMTVPNLPTPRFFPLRRR